MTLSIAFLRWVGSLVSGIFLFLGFIWITVDSRKQGWHDKIAATLVVRVGNEPGTEVYPTAHSPLDIQPLTDTEAPSSALLPLQFLQSYRRASPNRLNPPESCCLKQGHPGDRPKISGAPIRAPRDCNNDSFLEEKCLDKREDIL